SDLRRLDEGRLEGDPPRDLLEAGPRRRRQRRAHGNAGAPGPPPHRDDRLRRRDDVEGEPDERGIDERGVRRCRGGGWPEDSQARAALWLDHALPTYSAPRKDRPHAPRPLED